MHERKRAWEGERSPRRKVRVLVECQVCEWRGKRVKTEDRIYSGQALCPWCMSTDIKEVTE